MFAYLHSLARPCRCGIVGGMSPQSRITLREASFDDVDPLASFSHASASDRERFLHFVMHVRPGTLWIAQRSGVVVGFVGVEAVGPGHLRSLHVTDLLVHEGIRRQGWATRLLGMAIGESPAFAVIPEEAAAVGFFVSQGFERVSEAEGVWMVR